MNKIVQKNFKLIAAIEKNFRFLIDEYEPHLEKYVYDGPAFGNEYLELIIDRVKIRFSIDRGELCIGFMFKSDKNFYTLGMLLEYLNHKNIKCGIDDMKYSISEILRVFKNKNEFEEFKIYTKSNNTNWIKENFNK